MKKIIPKADLKIKTLFGPLLLTLVILTLIGWPLEAEEARADEWEEPPTYPQLGLGAQFIFPSGGLSGRYWLSRKVGLELNASLWSSPQAGINGTVGGRFISQLTEGKRVNFYVAGGGAYDLGDDFVAVGTGGISLALLSPDFHWNFEFGLFGRGIDDFGPSFGLGFHYYFSLSP